MWHVVGTSGMSLATVGFFASTGPIWAMAPMFLTGFAQQFRERRPPASKHRPVTPPNLEALNCRRQ
jgi:uncharacterized protein YraI